MYTRCDNQSVLERLNETENKLLFLHEVRQCPDSDLYTGYDVSSICICANQTRIKSTWSIPFTTCTTEMR
ncbi:hypothetical protein Trydic_g10874 [Trypoxylus dichotomus]